MSKIVLLIAGFVCLGSVSQSQNVAGTVKDQQGKGLVKSTVSLLNAKDSSIVKLAASAENGRFSIATSKTGKFLVSTSHVGYKTAYSKVFELSGAGDFELGEIIISKAEGDLRGVTVTSHKPMVEVRADKTILNVEGTINSIGNDALDLLRKSPGVMVDKDENISLAGKNGVQIYIDGKPSPLTGTDLAAYLKSLQSAQIESIEIITNPSAKYDAAGNAGIINIKLKKNKSFGTNGSVNAGYNIGVYPKYNAGISLNHRNKNINIFGNYNYNDSKNNVSTDLYRVQMDTIFNQINTVIPKSISHGFKTGLDYFINKKSTIGVLINGNISTSKIATDSRTEIQYQPTKIIDRVLIANNRANQDRNNVNFNLNYRYADTSGRELNLDADYGLFRIKTNQLQPNYYYNPSGTVMLSQRIYKFISPTDIDIYTVKGDYEQNYKKGRLGIGAKVSVIKTMNNFGRYDVQQLNPEIKQLDIPRSNQFNYSENINAAYINYNKQYKGLMVQAGLRLENTISSGDSYAVNADASVNTGSKLPFKRNYTDLFPSAALSFNKKPEMQWGLSYSRRIDRPAYQNLNPFEFKLDEYMYMKGNKELRPQYSNIFSLSNTYKYKLTTRLSYSHVTDIFTQLIDTIEKTKSFQTTKNLATQDVFNLNISYPYNYKSYSAFVNFSSNYSHYKADFGGGNRVVNLDAFAFNIYMQQSVKIGKKGWSAETSGWYNSPFIWGGTFKGKSLWDLDAGIQKTIFKGNGNFKISVTDIFNTQHFRGSSNFAGQMLDVVARWESRQLRTSLTWRFGSKKVNAARQRKVGLEEESNRTQNSGGGIGQQ